MALNIFNKWKDFRKEFEAHTGQKMPQEIIQKSFVGIFGGFSGVGSTLKKVDSCDEKLAKAFKQKKPQKEALDHLKEAFEHHQKAVSSYLDVLQKEADTEMGFKKEKTAYYHGLKLLKARLEVICAEIDKYIFDCEQEVIGELDVFVKIEASLNEGIILAIKHCIVDIERLHANPTRDLWVEIFDSEDSGARALTTALQQIVVLKEGGRIISYKNDREVAYKELLHKYISSYKVKKLRDSEEDKLEELLSEFEACVYRIKDKYQL